MQRLFTYYRYFNLLSLDVAFGAAVSAYFLTNVFDVHVKPQGLVCLGLTVWLIYTADHLVDARIIKNEASTMRHRFHQQYFKTIFWLAIGIFISILPLLFFIYKPVLDMGIRLALLVVVYFLVQRKLHFLKEVLGAMLYCVGVMLPIIAMSEMSVKVLHTLPAVLFFNTALINLVLFSWFDRDKDRMDNHPSLVTSVGDKIAQTILYALLLIQLVLLSYAFMIGTQFQIWVVFFLMYLVLLFIFLKANWFSCNDRYRLAGDAVFLIPICYWML